GFLFRRRPSVGIDPSFGDERLAALRAAAREGARRWPEIRTALSGAQDPEDLTFLVEGLRSVAGLERWIGEVIAAEPDEPLPLLVSGARHVGWAWHARSGLAARYVSDEQWALFRGRLETAQEQLLAAAESAPDLAAPWYFLQITARGLRAGANRAGADVEEQRFTAACRHAPGHLAAHRERLLQLTPAWGGSREEMHGFARRSMLAAPAGSPLGELVAAAFLEEWLDRGGDPESVYMRSGQVLGALHEAADRSVRQQSFVRERDWPLTFNTFAMAFALAGDEVAARPLFRAIGDRATEMPWRYLDDRSPLVPFLEWRSRVNR
ncbi:hypothetical protein, partial [Actinacidiphila acidipaludis]